MNTPEQENDPAQERQEGWKDVFDQFAALGESIGRAIEASWQHPKTQEVVSQIMEGLRKAAEGVDEAIGDVKNEQAVQDFFEDARETFEVLEEQGKQALEKARPHVQDALKNLSAAINDAINKLNTVKEEADQQEKSAD